MYLELIGPDPSQEKPPKPRWFDLDTLLSPRLITWAAKATDLDHLAAAARNAGVFLGAKEHAGFSSRRRPMIEVSGLGRPRNKTRREESIEIKPTWPRRLFLGRIGTDQLQVHGRSQADQRIARALARVTTARYRANPCQFLDAIDLPLEVGTAPDEVIDGRSPDSPGW